MSLASGDAAHVPASGPLRHEDLYHSGFVVADLQAAKEDVGRRLGLTWLEGGGHVRMHTPDGSFTAETKYALSVEGPHHVELVQAVPGTLYTTSTSLSAHHLGYWVDDVTAASAALATSGMPNAVSVSIEGSDRGPIACYHQMADGFYVELVSRWMKRVLFPPARER